MFRDQNKDELMQLKEEFSKSPNVLALIDLSLALCDSDSEGEDFDNAMDRCDKYIMRKKKKGR